MIPLALVGVADPLALVGVTDPFVFVGAGGVCGALARHLVGERVESRVGGTLVVNVCGSFALGVLVAAPVSERVALAAGTGFCGAFTTFSTFAFETVRLFETGERRRALVNASGTLAATLVAVVLGSVVGATLPL